MTAIEYAKSLLHVPYIWGGKSPLIGLDCSGFVCEVLKSVGAVGNHEELSAQGLFDRFNGKGINYMVHLAFFGKDLKSIDHVGILDIANNQIDSRTSLIEAAGGDHTTITREIAEKIDARVKVRPVGYRKDLVASIVI